YFLVQPDSDRSFRANPCNSLLVSFHDSRMSLIKTTIGAIVWKLQKRRKFIHLHQFNCVLNLKLRLKHISVKY
ncbi:MAG: hypothetical protein V7K69_24905, partial [Nostoc sp.]|uniref:hypothetical protein n=1 Tax=Nostoc sp. TaxID=1180 RepID=UPI002FF64334